MMRCNVFAAYVIVPIKIVSITIAYTYICMYIHADMYLGIFWVKGTNSIFLIILHRIKRKLEGNVLLKRLEGDFFNRNSILSLNYDEWNMFQNKISTELAQRIIIINIQIAYLCTCVIYIIPYPLEVISNLLLQISNEFNRILLINYWY